MWFWTGPVVARLLYEPVHESSNNVVCAISKASDKLAQYSHQNIFKPSYLNPVAVCRSYLVFAFEALVVCRFFACNLYFVMFFVSFLA